MWSFFDLKVDEHAVATLTFARPPVNALSDEVYRQIRDVSLAIGQREDIATVILTAPLESKAWCGGADLNELQTRTGDSRALRYEGINQAFDAFYNIQRPVIAAVNGHAIGAGVVWASLCDMRIGAAESYCALAEIQRGMSAGLNGFFNRLSMPEGLIREMLFTGDKYTGEQLRSSGFFNEVVPRADVLQTAYRLARRMSHHKLAALRATKAMVNDAEHGPWLDNYKKFQKHAIALSAKPGSTDGMKQFLAKGQNRPGT